MALLKNKACPELFLAQAVNRAPSPPSTHRSVTEVEVRSDVDDISVIVHVERLDRSSTVRVWAPGALEPPIELIEGSTRGTGGTCGPCALAMCGLLASDVIRDFIRGSRNAIELGAGIGFGGLVMSASLSIPMLLTDSDPDVMFALRSNSKRGSHTLGAHLTWSREPNGAANMSSYGGDGTADVLAPFDLVIALDCVTKHNQSAFVQTVLGMTHIGSRLMMVSRQCDDDGLDDVCGALSTWGSVERLEGWSVGGVSILVALWRRKLIQRSPL